MLIRPLLPPPDFPSTSHDGAAIGARWDAREERASFPRHMPPDERRGFFHIPSASTMGAERG